MQSIPRLGAALDEQRHRLAEIPGMVPSLRGMPAGCSFAPRCGLATDQCRAAPPPPLAEHRPGRWVACWHAGRLLGDAA
jgi:oligopeptide/dipeptide ABC transporter ATP-binding protein